MEPYNQYEDIADEYFENLVWSSFLDGVQKNLLGDIKTCKMHDLVHDLAKFVAGDQEFACLKVSELNDTSKMRRLQLILDADLSSTVFLKSLSNANKLRTVFIPEGSNLVDPCIFSENKHLRILHVGRSPSFSYPKLPFLSLKPRHLRYLHLISVDLREVKNDESIRKLYNLETLVLTCLFGVQNLLTNMQSLQKLRYLEVSWTDMVELPDSVTTLSNLETLDLNHSDLKVIPESISGLKGLRFLNLSFNPFEELPVSVTTLSNLETLDVNTCKNLKALPESVRGLARLRIFDFRNFPLLRELPDDFGGLTQLRYLSLESTWIRVLPESCANLNNLEYVDLSKYDVPKYVKNWSKLREFNSGKGNILGAGELVWLETLRYSVPKKCIHEAECNVGIEELKNLNFLKSLSIWNLQNAENPMDAARANLKGKQNLRILYLHWGEGSHDPEVFEALQPPTGLRKLTITNFRVRVFPRWMCVPSGLPNLRRLDLINCKGIKKLPDVVQAPRLTCLCLKGMRLESLDIGEAPSLIQLEITDMFLLEELCYSYPHCLQHLWINGCKRLTEIPSFPCLVYMELKNIDHKLVYSVGRSQTSLTTLFLENIEGLVYFPISILQNNSNLRVLDITGCNQFQGFGINDDSSLQKLQFVDCPVLKFLPDLRGWTSLRELVIFNCPQVKRSITYDLKSLSFLKKLNVDFIKRDETRGDPSTYEDLITLMRR